MKKLILLFLLVPCVSFAQTGAGSGFAQRGGAFSGGTVADATTFSSLVTFNGGATFASGTVTFSVAVTINNTFTFSADGDTFKIDLGTALHVLDLEINDSRKASIDSTGAIRSLSGAAYSPEAGTMIITGSRLLGPSNQDITMQSGAVNRSIVLKQNNNNDVLLHQTLGIVLNQSSADRDISLYSDTNTQAFVLYANDSGHVAIGPASSANYNSALVWIDGNNRSDSLFVASNDADATQDSTIYINEAAQLGGGNTIVQIVPDDTLQTDLLKLETGKTVGSKTFDNAGASADTVAATGGTASSLYFVTWTSDPGAPQDWWAEAKTDTLILHVGAAIVGTPSYNWMRLEQ